MRKDAGLSQKEVAERAGTSVKYISEIENGTKSPTIFKLINIVYAIGRPLIIYPGIQEDENEFKNYFILNHNDEMPDRAQR